MLWFLIRTLKLKENFVLSDNNVSFPFIGGEKGEGRQASQEGAEGEVEKPYEGCPSSQALFEYLRW